MKKSEIILTVIMCMVVSIGARESLDSTSADDTSLDDLIDMDLDALLDMPITVASGAKALTQRESPGIVTVVTAHEIKQRGLRDLKEILEFVPGFNFAHDIQGVVSTSIRGNWASEGKVLVLIDGIDMNEDMYASIALGQRFSADMIERVEIIRGPGSVSYGGAAEMAVVSVVTKKPSEAIEGTVTANYSTMKDAVGRTGGNLYFGSKKEGMSFSGFVNATKGSRTDRVIADPYGGVQDMSVDDNAALESLSGLVTGSIQNLTVRLLYDNYSVKYTYPGEGVSDYYTDYLMYVAKAEYRLAISDELTIAPSAQYKMNRPWAAPTVYYDTGEEFEEWEVDDETQKYTVDIPVSYDITPDINFLTGVAYEYIQGRDDLMWGTFNGENYVEYYNTALYAQIITRTGVGNFIAGARGNYHNQFGSSIVPRVAYTNTFMNDIDVKLLASGAQRDPVMHNYDYNRDIKPERTWVLESELGYRATSAILFQSNVFWMQMNDAIVYTWDEQSGSNIYLNSPSLGSWGVELTGRYKFGGVSAQLNYSFARNHGEIVANYVDPFNDDRKLAIPEHKITGAATYTFADQLHVTPSVRYIGARSAIYLNTGDYADPEDEDSWYDEFHYKELDSVVLLDLVLVWNPVFHKNLEITVAGYNLTDDMNEMGQPYDGYDVPLPGASREVSGKVSYSF